jgi:hypothetical protein
LSSVRNKAAEMDRERYDFDQRKILEENAEVNTEINNFFRNSSNESN